MKMLGMSQEMDHPMMLILMEAVMKTASMADSSILMVVQTAHGRSWVGKNKLKDAFLNGCLQLEPDDNEYILNHESQSFLRQPSVTEQEHNHQLYLNQQKQRERIANKLVSTAGVKRNAGSVSGASTTPTSASGFSSVSSDPPLQLVPLKKVKYHERKKTQNQDRASSKVATTQGGGAGGAFSDSGAGISDSTSHSSYSANAQASAGAAAAAASKRRKSSEDSESRSDSSNHNPAAGNNTHQRPPPGEHEGTRRRIKIPTPNNKAPPPPPLATTTSIIKQEIPYDSASDDGHLAADNASTASTSSLPRTPPPPQPPLSSAPSPTPSPAPSTASAGSYAHSSASDSHPSEIPPETLARFEDAKALDLSAGDLFDNSSQTYQTVSSILYEYASHWARQSPIDCKGGGGGDGGGDGGGGGGRNGKNDDDVKQFFADRFDAWFEELDPEGGSRQVKSFLRTMAMKSYGSVRNKIIKKIAEAKRGDVA